MPPDAVEPLFKQVVNQFVNDRSRTEVSLYYLVVVTFLSCGSEFSFYADFFSGHRCWTECGEGDMSTNASGNNRIQ